MKPRRRDSGDGCIVALAACLPIIAAVVIFTWWFL